jgi:hypothetical protein
LVRAVEAKCKRQKHVVNFGIGTSPDPDKGVREKHDRDVVENMLTQIKVKNVKINCVIRLKSKIDGTLAPIIVNLNTIYERNTVLGAAKKLAKIRAFEKTYGNPDLTLEERIVLKRLRAENSQAIPTSTTAESLANKPECIDQARLSVFPMEYDDLDPLLDNSNVSNDLNQNITYDVSLNASDAQIQTNYTYNCIKCWYTNATSLNNKMIAFESVSTFSKVQSRVHSSLKGYEKRDC